MKIILFIESSNNTIHPVSLETIVAAQKLKSDTNVVKDYIENNVLKK